MMLAMGEKKTGPEMVAETLREIAVLVAVFYSLDIYLNTGPIDLAVTTWVGLGCILSDDRYYFGTG